MCVKAENRMVTTDTSHRIYKYHYLVIGFWNPIRNRIGYETREHRIIGETDFLVIPSLTKDSTFARSFFWQDMAKNKRQMNDIFMRP